MSCGSAFARVADISGRRDDDFVYGSHAVPASAFRHVLGTDPRIVEYQVLQTEGGVDVLVVADADVQALAPALVTAMQRHGVARPSIRTRRRDPGPQPSQWQTQALRTALAALMRRRSCSPAEPRLSLRPRRQLQRRIPGCVGRRPCTSRRWVTRSLSTSPECLNQLRLRVAWTGLLNLDAPAVYRWRVRGLVCLVGLSE